MEAELFTCVCDGCIYCAHFGPYCERTDGLWDNLCYLCGPENAPLKV